LSTVMRTCKSGVILCTNTVCGVWGGGRTVRSNEGSALRGLKVQVTAVCDTSLVGEAHSVLPMNKEAGAESTPKLVPVTVTTPPAVGLTLETKETDGASARECGRKQAEVLSEGEVLTVFEGTGGAGAAAGGDGNDESRGRARSIRACKQVRGH